MDAIIGLLGLAVFWASATAYHKEEITGFHPTNGIVKYTKTDNPLEFKTFLNGYFFTAGCFLLSSHFF